MRFAPALRPILLLFCLLPSPPLPAQDTSLARRIQAFTGDPRFAGSRWGIRAVSLDTGRVLVDQDGGKYFTPASNTKLFTCALALCRLGEDRRIRTSVVAGQNPGPEGHLPGDLVLVGRGDPLLLARWRGGASGSDPLETLALQVKAAGVRVVEGDVVGDDSAFAARPYGSGWEIGDRDFAFGADVSALTLHDNRVELRVYPGTRAGSPCFLFPQPGLGLLPLVNGTTTAPAQPLRGEWTPAGLRITGSLPPGAAPATLALPVREPALFAAQLFRRALERQGIRVRGAARALHAQDRTPAPRTELAHLDSPPLREMVKATLKDSINLYAQLLLLQAGGGTEEGGLAALRDFLKEAGIPADDVLLEEGSGLSRRNLIKPTALTALLRHMAGRPEGTAFREALPLAAVDGSLRGRLGEAPAAVNIQAKTGTLRNTHALSGYLTTAGGDHLAFAILLNNHPGTSAQADVDAVAAMLAETGRE